MYKETDSTFLVTMTKGELKELIAGILGEVMINSALPAQKPTGRLVYGLKGIRDFFGVSLLTAQRYKAGVIKEAVRQHGRKIVVDADLADLRAHDIDHAFEHEWSDVTDILRLPSLRSIDLQIKIGDGLIQLTKVEGCTYCKNTDIEKIYGTPDYFIKIRRRNGTKRNNK